MLDKFPIEVVNGLPVLQDSLKWRNDCNLYVMSGYSALSVGPMAGNLLGGKICSERIAESVWRDWAQEMGEELVETTESKKPELKTLADIAANMGNYWSALESCNE